MNAGVVHQKIGRYQLGLVRSLTPTQGAALLKLIESPATPQSSDVLSGRGTVTHGEIPGLGRVVVKRYHRGGLLGKVNRATHIRSGRVRSRAEFERLMYVRALGVAAPEPIGYVFTGFLLYNAWLIMREIENYQSLARMSTQEEDRARHYTELLAADISKLVEARMYHVDLHPGNVLIDGTGQRHIIDFDKAVDFYGSRNDLRDRYLVRWRRAVIKHSLPEFLSEILSAALRKHFEA